MISSRILQRNPENDIFIKEQEKAQKIINAFNWQWLDRPVEVKVFVFSSLKNNY